MLSTALRDTIIKKWESLPGVHGSQSVGHFREININIHKDYFTVVAIGDMGGDVFGNGMLYTPNIRLIAAFNGDVGDAVQLDVMLGRGPIVQQKHCAIPVGEELFQRQDLAPVAERVTRQEANLR